jgi:hypothetical protein
MFLRCFSSLLSCSHRVFSMPLNGSFLGFLGGLELVSGFSVHRTLLCSVDVDGFVLDFTCVNIDFCLHGVVGHGER